MDLPELPPLPEPTGFLDVGQFKGGLFAHYTANDLRAFALEAVRRERERCEMIAISWSDKSYEAEQIAQEIALRSRSQETSNG